MDPAETGAETLQPGQATQLVPGLAEAAADAREPLTAGATVGRFVVLSRVGVGGMGVVYAAYDPELDRKLALKLLAPTLRSHAGVRARMLREAQAMARLQHPNVVAVHDVGVRDEQVWVAMEFIEGETLGTWLKSHPRTWREVLAVMRAVARGLSAAHAAGLVHRDIKPDNIMIGADGRARVMDFGLVRAQGDAWTRDPDLEASQRDDTSGSRSQALDLTEAGSVMGTPLYMAPEQHLGQPVDARTDQFSWCVTCWEALHGQRPFRGHDIHSLALSVVAGELRPPPPGSKVPPWLRRTLERGLSPQPERRYPDMTALLAALQRGRVRARWRVALVAAAAAVVLALAVAVGLRVRHAQAVQRCEAAGAAIRETWNPGRRDAIARAFADTGAPHAPASLERVAARFDAYADEWERRRTDVCLQAEIDDALPASAALALSLCLGDRQAALQGLVEHFSVSDPGLVVSAVLAAWNLPTLASCADEPRQLPASGLGEELAVQARLVRLRRELVAISTLTAIGRFPAAIARAEALRPEAVALGRPALLVELALAEGAALDRSGEHAAAERSLERALWLAFGEGLDNLVARVAARLVFVVGYRLNRVDEALRWGELGEAALRRLGGGTVSDRATLLAALAATHGSALNVREELRLSEESLALEAIADGPDHPNVGIFSSNLGRTYADFGDLEAAERLLDRALSLLESSLGPGLSAGIARLNRGFVDLRRGDYVEASGHFQRAHDVLAGAYGATRLEAVYAGLFAAEALARAGYFDAAEQTLVDLATVDSPTLVSIRLRVQARIAAAAGDLAHALELASTACTMIEDDPEEESACLALVGDLHLRRGDCQPARASYEAAVAAAEPGLGATGPVLADSLTGLAEALLGLGDLDGASRRVERARDLQAARPGEPASQARTRFALARVDWARGREADAQAHARAAWALLRRSEGEHPRELADIETWLATRGGL